MSPHDPLVALIESTTDQEQRAIGKSPDTPAVRKGAAGRSRRATRLTILPNWCAAGSPFSPSASPAAPRSPSPIRTAPSAMSPSSTSSMTTCRSWSIRPSASSTERGHRSAPRPASGAVGQARRQGKLAALEDKAEPGCADDPRKLSSISIIARISDRGCRELEGAISRPSSPMSAIAVLDWRAMQQRLREAIATYQAESAADPDRGTDRIDRLPAVAARQPLHLPRHARIRLRGRRQERRARARSPNRASASCARPRSRCCGAAKSSSPCRRRSANS